jgi:hypothetical protein
VLRLLLQRPMRALVGQHVRRRRWRLHAMPARSGL